jgi:glycosyltransferase involved in cell wall biosynthesis
MKNTVAVVANNCWNIYNFRQPLLKAYAQAGYKVIVIAPVDEYVHYLDSNYFAKHIPLRHLSPQGKNPLRDLLLFLELFLIFRRERPELILTYTVKPNIYGNLAARWLRLRSIPTLTGLGYVFMHNSPLARLARAMYKWAMQRVDFAFFHNHSDRDLFDQLKVLPKARSAVIPGSGLNTNHFRPLPRPRREGFVFLFLGRLLYDKGIAEFAEAAKKLRYRYPNAECWVAGQLDAENPSAIPRHQLLEWVSDGQIRYFGKVQDVRPLLKCCDAMVLPSYREGMPRAVLEAMAMGKPVITTLAPGCREAVTSDCGWRVPPRDAKALSEAMEEALQLPGEQLQAMGAMARRRAVRVFDEQHIVAAYLNLMEAESKAALACKAL